MKELENCVFWPEWGQKRVAENAPAPQELALVVAAAGPGPH